MFSIAGIGGPVLHPVGSELLLAIGIYIVLVQLLPVLPWHGTLMQLVTPEVSQTRYHVITRLANFICRLGNYLYYPIDVQQNVKDLLRDDVWARGCHPFVPIHYLTMECWHGNYSRRNKLELYFNEILFIGDNAQQSNFGLDYQGSQMVVVEANPAWVCGICLHNAGSTRNYKFGPFHIFFVIHIY